MEQKNSQTWSVGCSDGVGKNWSAGGGGRTRSAGAENMVWERSVRYMKSESAFNFSRT